MPTALARLLNTPLAKNRFAVEFKFLLDALRGRNRFITHGRRVARLPRPPPAPGARHVVFPTVFYLDRALAWQVTVASALAVRGHRVTFLPLDLAFPRRNTLYFDDWDGGFAVRFFRRYTNALLSGFGMPRVPYSEFGSAKGFAEIRRRIAGLDLAGCRAFTFRGLPLGAMAENNVMHYFRAGPEHWTDAMIETYRDYIAIGAVLAEVLERAFDTLQPTAVFTLNGSFLDSQLQLALARARGIRVVTFEAGFMLNSLLFGINEPIVNFPLAQYLPPAYGTYRLNAEQERQLDVYLDTRSRGKESVFDYWGNPVLETDATRRALGLPAEVTPDILFTNLLWDSAMLNCDIAFESQRRWILETVAFYRDHPDRWLLLRIHPAEEIPAHLRSTDRVEDMLREAFPELPPNITVIPPRSNISSYPLTRLSDLTLVYSSTAGLEAAIMGKPVVVAARAHYRGQGFTHDVRNPKEYRVLLERPRPPAPPPAVVERARKYAYFFFFGFHVPFPLVTERPTNDPREPVAFNWTAEEQLLPGRDAGLDFTVDLLLGTTDLRTRLKSFAQ